MNENLTIDHPAPARRDRGFTLVELLIVIVILGILATVTVFAVRGITDKGAESACDADASTLATAYESFAAQYGTSTIPTGADPEPAGVTWSAGADAETTLVNAGLLRSVSTKWTLSPAGVLAAQDPACT